jgi:hypothetical protein
LSADHRTRRRVLISRLASDGTQHYVATQAMIGTEFAQRERSGRRD